MKDLTYSEAIEEHRKTEAALSKTVRIDWRQQMKLVAEDLVGKRNHSSCPIVAELDVVLKTYFFEEDEFQKYVINQEPIK